MLLLWWWPLVFIHPVIDQQLAVDIKAHAVIGGGVESVGSLNCGCTEPVQRTVKLVAADRRETGPVVPQLKLMVALVAPARAWQRPVNGIGAGGVRPIRPGRPVPLPAAAVFTKDALATPLLTAPAGVAMACTTALLVRLKGPVYSRNWCGSVPSSV
jgi:hypothetical protein